MTISSSWTKKLQNTSQSQLAPPKGHGYWWSVLSLIHYSFLDPGKTLHPRSMLSRLMSCTKKAQFFSTTMPDRSTNASEVERTGLWSFASSTVFTWPLANYHFLKHFDNFLHGKCFYNQQEVENAFQEFIESWSMDFCATGLSKLVSRWQKCVDCSGSYFD